MQEQCSKTRRIRVAPLEDSNDTAPGASSFVPPFLMSGVIPMSAIVSMNSAARREISRNLPHLCAHLCEGGFPFGFHRLSVYHRHSVHHRPSSQWLTRWKRFRSHYLLSAGPARPDSTFVCRQCRKKGHGSRPSPGSTAQEPCLETDQHSGSRSMGPSGDATV